MPYDIDWARSVHKAYKELHPRGQQILLCVQQVLKTEYSINASIDYLEKLLIRSIQGRASKKIWPRFKFVVKKSPLDQDALGKLVKAIAWDNMDETKQMLFDFAHQTT